ncbi:hypothetical protein D3C71_2088630 [compost metagenome]
MAMSVANAAAILLNQTVRDKAIPVLQDFQALSQSSSRLPDKAIAGAAPSIKADVDALCTALVAAGAITSFVS